MLLLLPLIPPSIPLHSGNMGSTDGPTWREIHPSSLSSVSLKAEGAGALVYRATIPASPHSPLQKVAVRKPRISSSQALFRFEAEISCRSRLSHPNLLPLLAACTSPPNYCTISPWMQGGTLFDALHAHAVRMSFPRLLHLAIQLASAMSYMHAQNLVHRDLKTANILLDAMWQHLVVADLDLAIDVNQLQNSASRNGGRAIHRGPSNGRLAHMVGTLVYMAPEVLSGKPHTFAADVYAFGVTINEMATAAVPFVDRRLPVPELHTVLETRFNEVRLRGAIVKNNLRPVLPQGVPNDFSALIEKCWHPEPSARPTFSQIVGYLESIMARGPDYLSQFSGATLDIDRDLAVSSKDLTIDDSNRLLDEIKFHIASPKRPVWEQRKSSPVHPSGMDIDPTPIVTVSAALCSTCGERGADRMEDRSLVMSDLSGLSNTHLFAVFDGHAGQVCSEFIANYFPGALYRAWVDENATPETALVHAFEDVDYAFLKESPSSEESGCTALATLVVNSTLFIANAGDCRCVLGRTDGSFVELSRDHVATDRLEKARVEARGGFVSANGRVQGKLMVSRALGDRSVKRYISSTPEVMTRTLSKGDDFMILASDGLWDVVCSQEAASLVRSTVRVPDLAAKRLVLKAIELGSDDNISVIVAFFHGNNSCSYYES